MHHRPTGKVVRPVVVCYIVRDGRLLVFRHLDYSAEEVGIQVPAGGIDSGEDPDDAALREATEETGVRSLRVVRKLGVAGYDISPYRMEIQQRHFYLLDVADDVSERWTCVEAASGGELVRLECFWIPLEHAHVLQSGQGAFIGRLFEPPA